MFWAVKSCIRLIHYYIGIFKHNQSIAEPTAEFLEKDSNTQGYMATNEKNCRDEHHMNESKNSLLKLTP
jgi:hypothetical protein